jgi:AmmeMemoRadiSam system protein A
MTTASSATSPQRSGPSMLSDEARHRLIDLARRSVEARVASQRLPAVPDFEWPQASGVFVTLKLHGELRGCLGTLESGGEFAADVVRCAADAASEDPRFPPLTASELADTRLEISVLTPLEAIAPDVLRGGRLDQALTIGVHGVVVERGRRRGLLLPQVATERGWKPEQFLRQTCVKAGLPPSAWETEALVFRFTAEVFGDGLVRPTSNPS